MRASRTSRMAVTNRWLPVLSGPKPAAAGESRQPERQDMSPPEAGTSVLTQLKSLPVGIGRPQNRWYRTPSSDTQKTKGGDEFTA